MVNVPPGTFTMCVLGGDVVVVVELELDPQAARTRAAAATAIPTVANFVKFRLRNMIRPDLLDSTGLFAVLTIVQAAIARLGRVSVIHNGSSSVMLFGVTSCGGLLRDRGPFDLLGGLGPAEGRLHGVGKVGGCRLGVAGSGDGSADHEQVGARGDRRCRFCRARLVVA